MLKQKSIALALSAAVLFPGVAPAQFATSVLSYTAGTDPAAGYTDPTTALGSPSTDSDGPVTPFAAPYMNTQLVSVGAGGSLTVEFGTPLKNDPLNPYGLDFLIFGGTSFIDFAWPDGIADNNGSTFGQNTGSTRVYAGNDIDNLFPLNPSLAPVVDGLFPTDGAGNFHLPVDPTLDNSSFANLTLDGIRALYAGSGGGTGFDLAWAVDNENNPVDLTNARYIRVDVVAGRSEIDAFAAVMVPEPSVFVLAAAGGFALFFIRRKRRG